MISNILAHFSNIIEQPYDQETGSIYNMLQEIEARTEACELLQLAPWCEKLRAANHKVEQLMANRNTQSSVRTDLRAKAVRSELEAIYQNTINRIDAMINLNGKDYVPGFFGEYNAHAKRFKDQLAIHQGRSAAKREKENKPK